MAPVFGFGGINRADFGKAFVVGQFFLPGLPLLFRV
jgi:hypothetical protein